MGRIRTGVAGVAVSGMILSSGAVVTAQEDPIELTATVVGIGTTAKALSAAAGVWNVENPNIQVRIEPRPEETVWQTTAPSTEFQANDGPDFSWWWCALPQNWREMSTAGTLAPLDDLWENEGWKEAGPQWSVDYYTDPIDGHMYGVPLDVVWVPVVYYNKDMFAELGLSVPTTWDEFYEVTAALADAGKIPLSAFYDQQHGNHLLQGLMLRSWSQDELDAFSVNWSGTADPASFEYKWTDPSSLRIFETMDEMRQNGVWGDGFQALTDYAQAISLWHTESAGMYVMGSWEAGSAVANAPFETDWFFYPDYDDTEALARTGSWAADCFIVFEDRPHVAESKQFLAWLLSPAGMDVMLANGAATPQLDNLPPETLAVLHPNAQALAEDINEAGVVPMWEQSVSPELFQGIKENVDLMLSGVLTPEEVAGEVQALTEEVRERS